MILSKVFYPKLHPHCKWKYRCVFRYSLCIFTEIWESFLSIRSKYEMTIGLQRGSRDSRDTIGWCAIWLAGAAVLWSRLRLRLGCSAPASRDRARSEGTRRTRKVEVVAHRPKSRTQPAEEKLLAPYLSSSAATETTATAASSITSERGKSSVGRCFDTPAPREQPLVLLARETTRGTHTAVRSRARFHDGLR